MEKKKRRLKKSIKKKLFYGIIGINIAWILLLIGYYSYRMYYYYKLEHKDTADTNYLVDTLTLEKNIVTTGSGLYHDKDSYWYYGKVKNNYVSYSGLLWRIAGIDENNNMKLVTDEVITMLSHHGTDYKTSDVYKWLNPSTEEHTGIFYQNLNQNDKMIIDTKLCSDVVKNPNQVTCEKEETVKVGLLSLNDYDKAGGKNSYINQGTSFYTNSMDSSKNVWVIETDGTITGAKANNTGYGVRPVITLKADTTLYQGTGTKEDPYQIETVTKTQLKDTNVGEYVQYSNGLYRVIGKENGNVKVIDTSLLPAQESFSDGSVDYDSTNYGTLAYQLNHDYTSYYQNPEWIQPGTFYTGTYANTDDSSYLSTYQNKIITNIGLPQVGDYFIGDVTQVYTLTPASLEDEMMISVENGKYYADVATKEKGVRPVFYLNGSLKITGNGTKENPYQLGV